MLDAKKYVLQLKCVSPCLSFYRYLHFCTKYEGSSKSVCTKTDKLHYPLDGNLQLPNKVSSIVTGILVVALHKKSMEQSYLYELKLDGLF